MQKNNVQRSTIITRVENVMKQTDDNIEVFPRQIKSYFILMQIRNDV